jgi:hypothetical protein
VVGKTWQEADVENVIGTRAVRNGVVLVVEQRFEAEHTQVVVEARAPVDVEDLWVSGHHFVARAALHALQLLELVQEGTTWLVPLADVATHATLLQNGVGQNRELCLDDEVALLAQRRGWKVHNVARAATDEAVPLWLQFLHAVFWNELFAALAPILLF